MRHNRFIIVFSAITLFISCAKEKKKAVFLRYVEYQEVTYPNGGNVMTFSGTAQTGKTINLSFRSSGIITEFNIKLGQQVRKNQLLAKLDNVKSRLSYEQAVSALNSAASQMNTAKLNLDRVRVLYEKGSFSLSDFENAKNSYKTAKESYESSKRSVAIEKEQVSYGYLVAPESGIIAAVNAEINENVSTGQLIAVLNAGSDMKILLGIPESVINRISRNMSVDIGFPSLPGQTFKGKVSEVSPSVGSNTSTYPVRVTVTKPSEYIKAGMAANVTFDFEADSKEEQQVLVVPAKAVGEDARGNFVFLVEAVENGKGYVKKQQIVIGKLGPEGFEVKSGLTKGQHIAIAGLQTLLDGQKVRIR